MYPSYPGICRSNMSIGTRISMITIITANMLSRIGKNVMQVLLSTIFIITVITAITAIMIHTRLMLKYMMNSGGVLVTLIRR